MPRQSPRQVTLRFTAHDDVDHVDDPLHRDLSAAMRIGGALFLTCDETSGIDRLVETDRGWGDHVHFSLGEMIDLPGGRSGEMDAEGLSGDEDWLWVCGSQSLKRGKPGKDDGRKAAMAAMARIESDDNRQFIGRVPLVSRDGLPTPVARDGKRRAQHLAFRKGGQLRRWLRDDPHIGPFLDLPSKENGLDVEGIAAQGLRVWLGLRGPVLRAHAVVIELELEATAKGRLKATKIDGDRKYRLHLLPTDGSGIRDLALDGDDILVVTGPVTTADGPSHLLRWRDAVKTVKPGLRDDDVEHVLELPYRGQVDHPEGLTRWHGNDWLVVYDSPRPARVKDDPPSVKADIWTL